MYRLVLTDPAGRVRWECVGPLWRLLGALARLEAVLRKMERESG